MFFAISLFAQEYERTMNTAQLALHVLKFYVVIDALVILLAIISSIKVAFSVVIHSFSNFIDRCNCQSI